MECCGNYRPISLLCVTYKLIAFLLLRRLQDGGAETRLSDSQFGFRRKRGTADAIFIARRWIEQAIALRGGRVALLALDWRMAFDSIHPSALTRALLRFGVPGVFVELISNIYRQRVLE